MGSDLSFLGKAAVLMAVLGVVVMTVLAVTGGFSEALRKGASGVVTGLTWPEITNSTAIGTTGEFPFLQTLTGCVNSTNVSIPAANYRVLEGDSDGGSALALTTTFGNQSGVNCSLTYRAGTTAQATADVFSVGIAIFATFAGVIVLALVGMVIVRLFRRTNQ